jgi:RecA/RadA recombinase
MAKEPLKKDERQKLLDSRLKSLGVLDRIVEGDKFDNRQKDYISTGITEINAELGNLPGFATGNLIELIGESGSGKTYVALKVAAEAQRKGMKVAFYNIENSFYEPRASEIGVITRDKDLFQLIPNLGSGEKMCDAIMAMVESGLYGLIVVDSITALIPEEMLEKDFDKPRKIGAHAVLVGALAQKLTYACGETNTTVILINQFRIGAGVIPNTFVKKATGGEGLLFYDHYRFSFRKIGGASGQVFNEEKEIIGGRSEITINKNRYGPPNKKVIFPIYFVKEESDPISDFIMRAKARNVELIKESGQKGKKKLKYITEDGEVIESGDARDFILKLKDLSAPESKTRNDNSTTVFEYICRKIKLDDHMIKNLNDRLESCVEYALGNELIEYEAEEPEEF